MEIKLTEAGLIAANAIENSEKHDTIFDSLTEEETNQFDFIITKLLTELEKEMTDGADFPHHNPFEKAQNCDAFYQNAYVVNILNVKFSRLNSVLQSY